MSGGELDRVKAMSPASFNEVRTLDSEQKGSFLCTQRAAIVV